MGILGGSFARAGNGVGQPHRARASDGRLTTTLPTVRNAGSVFVGDYSPQSAGDYAAGPNHVLPTAGAARFRGGLSVYDFVKVITVQQIQPSGLARLRRSITTLAEAEGLRAHAESVRLRCANA